MQEHQPAPAPAAARARADARPERHAPATRRLLRCVQACSATEQSTSANRTRRQYTPPESLTTRVMERVVVGTLSTLARLFMRGLSSTTTYGAHHVQDAIEYRPASQGLITISNHASLYDDPFTVAMLMKPHWFWRTEHLRYTLCATNHCFRNAVLAQLFRWGRVLPVERGEGIDQPHMRAVLGRIDAGEWIHVFPEGAREPAPPRLERLRRGIGYLVANAAVTPLVVPIVHRGMQRLLPRGSLVPRVGLRLAVMAGPPIDFSDLLGRADLTGDALYHAIAARCGQRLAELMLALAWAECERVTRLRAAR